MQKIQGRFVSTLIPNWFCSDGGACPAVRRFTVPE
jgi:hypothetical protein